MQKSGGETVDAFRAAMPSLRCCLRAEPDFPIGLFLLGLCYNRIDAESHRAAQLFHAAFTSAEVLPRGESVHVAAIRYLLGADDADDYVMDV